MQQRRELSSVGSERLPYKQRVGGFESLSSHTKKIKQLEKSDCFFVFDFGGIFGGLFKPVFKPRIP